MLESVKNLFISVFKASTCVILFIGVVGSFAALLAYFSGDRNDRASMTARIMVSLHEMKVVGDADLCRWLLKEGSESPETVFAEIRVTARTNPLWFKSFLLHLEPSRRLQLMSRLRTTVRD